jgi:perosamine synthetase
MDPQKLPAAITPRTRAIIPVHFAGHPCELEAIGRIAASREIPVIEDAAHAIESVYRGRKIGSASRATCFSFYATKNITTGEGGMITTNDGELAERLRILSLHGISVDAWKRYRPGEYKHWDILAAGYKYNMFDLQASLGIHQLAKVGQMWEQRRRWTERYDAAFAELPAVIRLEHHADVRCAYHLYVLRFVTEQLNVSREDVMQELQRRGVGLGIHFRPVHLHPFYRRKYGFEPGNFPIAEYAGQRVISLPLFPGITEPEVRHVIEQVREVSRKRRSCSG